MDDKTKSLVKKLLSAIEAKDGLLASYRTGRCPSEALWKRLDQAKGAIEEAQKLLEAPVHRGADVAGDVARLRAIYDRSGTP